MPTRSPSKSVVAWVALAQAVFLALTGFAAAGTGPSQTNSPLSGREQPAFVQVRDGEGRAMDGLAAEDFRISVDGRDSPLVEIEEFDRSDSSSLNSDVPIHLVFYVSDNLDVRQKYRARRAVAALLAELDLKRDSAAVYANGALSGFTQDRARLREMAAFFAEEVDRFEFGLPPPPPVRWREHWPRSDGAPGEAEVARDLQLLTKQGARGRLSNTLSLLKPLPEWKVLFYFGRDVPYRDEELERHDLRFAARILGDAGFSVFAFNPSGANDSGTERLSIWAHETGGRAVSTAGDLRQTVLRTWSGLNHGYRLIYWAPTELDCRWHDLRVHVARPNASATWQGGYFDTVNAAMSLTERTFLTVALTPARFSDFPVELAAALDTADASLGEMTTTGTLRVALRFPFSVAAPEGTTLAPGEKFHQRFLFYLGVFDKDGMPLGDFSSPAFFDLDSEQLASALAELARLDQEVEVSRTSPPSWLTAIVVAGKNERISTQIYRFPNTPSE